VRGSARTRHTSVSVPGTAGPAGNAAFPEYRVY
jgi:hypothetical protein